MKAVQWGHLDSVKELDRHSTDFFTKDSDGRTLVDVTLRGEVAVSAMMNYL